MITKEQALYAAEHREWLHAGPCKRTVGPRGGIVDDVEQWRPSGRCRTWKTRPAEFRLPLKYGLYRSGDVTHYSAHLFHLASECPLLADRKTS